MAYAMRRLGNDLLAQLNVDQQNEGEDGSGEEIALQTQREGQDEEEETQPSPSLLLEGSLRHHFDVLFGTAREELNSDILDVTYTQRNSPPQEVEKCIASLSRVTQEDSGCSCSVCQEELPCGDEVVGLECGHNFHHACISEWIRRQPTCPVCRANIMEPGVKLHDIESEPHMDSEEGNTSEQEVDTEEELNGDGERNNPHVDEAAGATSIQQATPEPDDDTAGQSSQNPEQSAPRRVSYISKLLTSSRVGTPRNSPSLPRHQQARSSAEGRRDFGTRARWLAAKYKSFPIEDFKARWEEEYRIKLAGNVEDLLRLFVPDHLEERVSRTGKVSVWVVENTQTQAEFCTPSPG